MPRREHDPTDPAPPPAGATTGPAAGASVVGLHGSPPAGPLAGPFAGPFAGPDGSLSATLSKALAALSGTLYDLASRGEIRRYRKGTLLIQEGDLGDTLFIILAGRLRAFSADDNDREITYGVYGPGEYIGEMSLDGGRRSASVITLEDSQCAVVTRRTLEAFVAEHPAFAFELLAKVIRRARAATLSTRQLALNDVYGRLKLLLDALAEPRADGTRVIGERLTHQEIANRIGCSREMVSRLMKDLERGGHTATSAGRLTLLKTLPQRW